MGRELYYFASKGEFPAQDSLAARLLCACCFEDEALWDELGLLDVDEEELEGAVKDLRDLGWEFFYGVLQ